MKRKRHNPEQIIRKLRTSEQLLNQVPGVNYVGVTWTPRAKQAPEHIREAWIGTSWIVVHGDN